MQNSLLTWETAPDVLTVKEAAFLVRVSRNAIYGTIQSGILPAANFGKRRIRIAKGALQQVFGLEQGHLSGTAAFSRDSGGKK